jgi:phage shock protein PspC (stress-responsive transcriptional regulator)
MSAIRDLAKVQDDRVLFGVCGGLGKYTPIPSWMWRAIFIITTLMGGFGLVVYIVLAICMPREKTGGDDDRL